MKEHIILASTSPRRRELLTQMGLKFEVEPAAGQEIYTASRPADIVQELAAHKAGEIQNRHLKEEGLLVIGADTIVVKNGKILGKPKDEADAFRMLQMLSGDSHQVYTGVCLGFCQNGKNTQQTFAERTDVFFYPLTEEEIRWYIRTGEPMDKAGSYGIQGRGGLFVKKINGDYSNVVGLPAAALYHRLKEILNFV